MTTRLCLNFCHLSCVHCYTNNATNAFPERLSERIKFTLQRERKNKTSAFVFSSKGYNQHSFLGIKWLHFFTAIRSGGNITSWIHIFLRCYFSIAYTECHTGGAKKYHATLCFLCLGVILVLRICSVWTFLQYETLPPPHLQYGFGLQLETSAVCLSAHWFIALLFSLYFVLSLPPLVLIFSCSLLSQSSSIISGISLPRPLQPEMSQSLAGFPPKCCHCVFLLLWIWNRHSLSCWIICMLTWGRFSWIKQKYHSA